MGEIAEFFKSDRRIDIVTHYGFTSVHIASAYAPDDLFYQFFSKGWVALNTGLYRLFEITCKCHIFIFESFAPFIICPRVTVCFADQALGGLHRVDLSR